MPFVRHERFSRMIYHASVPLGRAKGYPAVIGGKSACSDCSDKHTVSRRVQVR